jgi:hypothetical protein
MIDECLSTHDTLPAALFTTSRHFGIYSRKHEAPTLFSAAAQSLRNELKTGVLSDNTVMWISHWTTTVHLDAATIEFLVIWMPIERWATIYEALKLVNQPVEELTLWAWASESIREETSQWRFGAKDKRQVVYDPVTDRQVCTTLTFEEFFERGKSVAASIRKARVILDDVSDECEEEAGDSIDKQKTFYEGKVTQTQGGKWVVETEGGRQYLMFNEGYLGYGLTGMQYLFAVSQLDSARTEHPCLAPTVDPDSNEHFIPHTMTSFQMDEEGPLFFQEGTRVLFFALTGPVGLLTRGEKDTYTELETEHVDGVATYVRGVTPAIVETALPASAARILRRQAPDYDPSKEYTGPPLLSTRNEPNPDIAFNEGAKLKRTRSAASSSTHAALGDPS